MAHPTGAPSGAPGGSGAMPDPLSSLHTWGLRAMLAALNHLLDQDERARASLVPHAGRVLRIDIQPPSKDAPAAWLARWAPPVCLRVTEAGRLVEARPADPEPSVRMGVRASVDSLFDVLGQGTAGMQRHLRIEGDVLFAAAIGELARSLRWDIEEDLSRVTGDAAAHRVVSTAVAQHAAFGEALRRAGQSGARHFSAERGELVASGELRDHAERLSSLESRLSSLERRQRKRG